MHDPCTSSNALAWSTGSNPPTIWYLMATAKSAAFIRSKSVHVEHRTPWFKASVASHVWCWQSTSCSCGLHMPKKWWTINDNRWDIMWCMTCHWCPPNNPNVGINHSKLELITEHLKLPNGRDPTITGINWDALTGFASKRKAQLINGCIDGRGM